MQICVQLLTFLKVKSEESGVLSFVLPLYSFLCVYILMTSSHWVSLHGHLTQLSPHSKSRPLHYHPSKPALLILPFPSLQKTQAPVFIVPHPSPRVARRKTKRHHGRRRRPRRRHLRPRCQRRARRRLRPISRLLRQRVGHRRPRPCAPRRGKV